MEAFVSLVTNDSYALGALVLGRSLRNAGTLRKLALLITREVSMGMRLSQLWDELVLVEELDSGDAEHLSLLTRPELGVTFSKLHAWRLTQYTKCVFLDADTMVLQNVDELFEREELSAAPDIGWPDCFNSGVFVFEPSLDTFRNLLDLARQRGSFDGGDQGLLNTYWSEWATKDIKYHLPFIYNVTPNITYGYAPAFQRFGRNIKIIHFIGSTKPWQHHYNVDVDSVILSPGTYSSEHGAQDFIRQWWQLYTQVEGPQHQSYDWSFPTLGNPPPSSHHTPSHSHYTPFTLPHIITHTHHSSSSHPTLFISTNYPSLTPIHSTASHSDIIRRSDPYRTPLDHHSASELYEPTLPSYLTHSYPDHHSHTSLSFYSHEDLFDRVIDVFPVECKTPDVDSDCYYDDLEEFHSSIYYRLNSILLDDIIPPPLRISYPYSSDIFVGPPTSAYSSQGIEFPTSRTHSDYSFVPYTRHSSQPPTDHSSHPHASLPHSILVRSTEGDANSLPEGSPSERSVSPSTQTLHEREPGVLGEIKLSDSVLTVTPLLPPTYAPPSLLAPSKSPPRVEKDEQESASQEGQSSSQAQYMSDNTGKSVEQINFEQGHIDFHGSDSFENIQAHIEKMLGSD